eukprot:1153220-Rhodomonas_salina.1
MASVDVVTTKVTVGVKLFSVPEARRRRAGRVLRGCLSLQIRLGNCICTCRSCARPAEAMLRRETVQEIAGSMVRRVVARIGRHQPDQEAPAPRLSARFQV